MIRTAIFVAAVAVLLAWLGPDLDIDDHSAERDQADEILAAQRQAQVQARYDRALQDICGPQSPWREISPGVVQCTDRAGKPTTTVSVIKE